MNKSTEFSPINVLQINSTPFNLSTTETAELEQIVTTTTYYPKKKIKSSLQDNPFAEEEFEIEQLPFKKEELRRVFIDVPKGTTILDFEFRLLSHPKAVIYKILSNYPILTEEEESLIKSESNELTRELFAARQVVRHGEKSKTPKKLILDTNGKVQYRRLFLSLTGKEDEDRRNDIPSDMYMTEEIKAEVNNNYFNYTK